MRALVNSMRSDRAQALDSLVEAAIHLQAAPQRSPGYLNAVNGLGVGYLAIRLYEPALEQYQRSRDDELFAQYRVSGLFRILNAQLAHLYWGLELDRIGSTDARSTSRRRWRWATRPRSHLAGVSRRRHVGVAAGGAQRSVPGVPRPAGGGHPPVGAGARAAGSS